ncbi:tetraacyldisaccharide 4'-kinase [Allopusillimonas ginsengisoli]|uniref:tetraacyldisaccharide 4'-kinase n=1 Tax=Allopusillimonas ginsengisoli TaxID=453575 RepID=UPI0039C2A677
MNIQACFHAAIQRAWQRKGLVSTLLLPFSWIAKAIIIRKRQRYQHHPQIVQQSRVPVIVVGNLYVGGTGKTPVVIALAQALQQRGWKPGIVSRGYGVHLGAHARTGQGDLKANEFGDEPALIAQQTQAPIAVHPRRALALTALEHTYPDIDVIIADDGLQHLALGRDLEIVVQDVRGIGNGRVLPAGPLREPASRLTEVDVIITNLSSGQEAPPVIVGPALQITMRLAPVQVTHLTSGRKMQWADWLAQYGQIPVSAVAAIGQPERFFSMLRHHGLALDQTLALPDHDAYVHSPFTAMSANSILITAKDAVKCANFADDRLWVLHAEPEFSDIHWLDWLHQRLGVLAPKKANMAAPPSRD